MITTTSYTESLARRFLSGAGALSLVPYRINPAGGISVLAHGIDGHGRILVACLADDVRGLHLPADGTMEVRLDGVKKAPEFDVDITVASLHALAQVSWLESGAAIPGADADASPHLRFGVLELDTVYVRGPHGMEKLNAAELLADGTDADTDFLNGLDAPAEVACLSREQLSALAMGVMAGVVPGVVLADRAQDMCAGHRNQLWLGDVDPHGIVLLESTDKRMTAVLVRFPEPVASLTDLAGAVAALAA